MKPPSLRTFSFIYLPSRTPRDYLRKILSGVFRFRRERSLANWIFQQQMNRPLAGAIDFINRSEIEESWLGKTIPVVNVSNQLLNKRTPAVTPDDLAVGAMAAEYFLGKGLREFAFLGPALSFNANLRLEGFRQVLLKEKMTCSTFFLEQNPDSLDSTENGLSEERLMAWLTGLPHGTGLFCHDDYVAVEVINQLTAAGRIIPETLRVLGVNNDEGTCEMAFIPLSSVDLNGEEIGYQAAVLLDHLLNGGSPFPRPLTIPPLKVVERRSTVGTLVADPVLNRLMPWAEEHIGEGISAKDLCIQAGLSARSLERRFKDTVGRTPHQWLIDRRMDKACALLRQRGSTLNSVAQQAGFPDVKALHRCFVERLGKSPGVWRKQGILQ